MSHETWRLNPASAPLKSFTLEVTVRFQESLGGWAGRKAWLNFVVRSF
jgi:hypothetical protein